MWGLTATSVYFISILTAYIHAHFANSGNQNPDASFKLWKCVSFLFQTALLWEVVITIVFWTLLWPYYPKDQNAFRLFLQQSKYHLLPLVYLTVDFTFNRIYFEWSHLWVQLTIFWIYGAVNIYVTLAYYPVYPIETWNAVGSVIAAIAINLFILLMFVGLFYLSEWKFAKLC